MIGTWQRRIKHISADALSVPRPAGVCGLVIALSHCYRVGEEDCSGRVECSISFFPWVIATGKWMLGRPPNVWLSDGNQLLHSDLVGLSGFEHY